MTSWTTYDYLATLDYRVRQCLRNKTNNNSKNSNNKHHTKIRLLSSSFVVSSPQCHVFPYQPLNAHKNEHGPCVSAPLDVNYRSFLLFLSGYLCVGSPLPPPTNGSRGGAEAEPRAFPRLLCCNYSCSQVYNLYYRFLVFLEGIGPCVTELVSPQPP